MKDLKHLIYFENLLQEANNELVQRAISDGKKAIAYTCYHIPEVLLNVDNCFSVRLRAPRTGSMDIISVRICADIPRLFWSAVLKAVIISFPLL